MESLFSKVAGFPALESLFNKVAGLVALESLFNKVKACNFIKKAPQHRHFCCEICKVLKNTYLEEHLRTTASELGLLARQKKKKETSYLGHLYLSSVLVC